jgi:predicted dehydrogenase
MATKTSISKQVHSTRRDFLITSSLLAAAPTVIAGASTAAAALHAGGSDTLKVGLIGCGGRGTGAAIDALTADKNVRLTAMADVFEDRLTSSLETLQKNADAVARINVPEERRFVGFDAYNQLISTDVDVVLMATPPHFRPAHLKAAVNAGKHVFCEKPVAVDSSGVRSVLETCKKAKEKGLSIVSGLCLREHRGFKEAIRRINEGAIGEIHTLFADDYRGPIWNKPRQPAWTDMHNQMHNWYYYTWLSGDFNVEQHVHYLDICSLIKGEYPKRAIGIGGRQVRTSKEYGNIYDHHSVTYEYEDGARLISNCRQQAGCKMEMRAVVSGSRGRADLDESKVMISGDSKWRYTDNEPPKSIYQLEHERLFASIRGGKAENDGEYMSKSTLLAIMGRMATYTGQVITWDQAMDSQELLGPAKYEWGEAPEVVIARPGVTKLI